MKIYAILFAAGAAFAQAITENAFAAACDGKAAGDSCTFETPGGSSSTGTCFSPANPSACGPDYVDSSAKCVMCGENPPQGEGGGSGDGGEGPGKENAATSACDDSDEGDSCAYTSPDGQKITGVCTDEGAGACGPVDPDAEDTSSTCFVCNSNPSAEGGDASGPTNTNECYGLSIGDECTVERTDDSGNAKEIVGVCSDTQENEDTSDGKLSCDPITDNDDVGDFENGGDGDDATDLISDALVKACQNLSVDDDCSYTDDESGNKVTGVCVTDGDSLQCDDESVGADDSSTDALVSACDKKSAGDSCSVDMGIVVISGACDTDESGNKLFCNPTPVDDSGS